MVRFGRLSDWENDMVMRDIGWVDWHWSEEVAASRRTAGEDGSGGFMRVHNLTSLLRPGLVTIHIIETQRTGNKWTCGRWGSLSPPRGRHEFQQMCRFCRRVKTSQREPPARNLKLTVDSDLALTYTDPASPILNHQSSLHPLSDCVAEHRIRYLHKSAAFRVLVYIIP